MARGQRGIINAKKYTPSKYLNTLANNFDIMNFGVLNVCTCGIVYKAQHFAASEPSQHIFFAPSKKTGDHILLNRIEMTWVLLFYDEVSDRKCREIQNAFF